MNDIKAFIDALQRKKDERYKALGILPGEGGIYALNMHRVRRCCF